MVVGNGNAYGETASVQQVEWEPFIKSIISGVKRWKMTRSHYFRRRCWKKNDVSAEELEVE